jgi:multidrug efflux pump subunit AcrA (membrane-fusion protein)
VSERGDNDVVRERPKDTRPPRLPDARRNSSGNSLKKRVRFVIIIARRSKLFDRNGSGCGETADSARIASEEARMAAETARTASEDARVATDAARHAVVQAVRATADALNASLEQMRVVEDMRRTLREIRDVHKLDSNSSGTIVSTTEQRVQARIAESGTPHGRGSQNDRLTNR